MILPTSTKGSVQLTGKKRIPLWFTVADQGRKGGPLSLQGCLVISTAAWSDPPWPRVHPWDLGVNCRDLWFICRNSGFHHLTRHSNWHDLQYICRDLQYTRHVLQHSVGTSGYQSWPPRLHRRIRVPFSQVCTPFPHKRQEKEKKREKKFHYSSMWQIREEKD